VSVIALFYSNARVQIARFKRIRRTTLATGTPVLRCKSYFDRALIITDRGETERDLRKFGDQAKVMPAWRLALSNVTTKKLLICENEGCNEQFIDEIDDTLTGDAASLPAALKAHKAGWKIVANQIFCPRCAGQVAMPN
jgi:hypothetical protein